MKAKRKSILDGILLPYLSGVVTGIALTVLALIAWALVRPVDRTPLTRSLMGSDADLEIIISEALLNQQVAEQLDKRSLTDLAQIVVDARPNNTLIATVQGPLDLGSLVRYAPKIDVEAVLGVEDDRLAVRIERAAIGPLSVDFQALPQALQPLLQSAEEAIEQAVNEGIQAKGFFV